MTENNYLKEWESKVERSKYFFDHYKNHFEESIQRSNMSLWTRISTQLLWSYQLRKYDGLVLRSQLGEITSKDLKEVRALPSSKKYYIRRSRVEPAHLSAYKITPLMFTMLACGGALGYSKLILGKNILWYAFSFIPLGLMLFYQIKYQPHEQLNNCYRYILSKRVGTVQLQEGATHINNHFPANQQVDLLKNYMLEKKVNLYQVQNDLISDFIKQN